MNNTEQLLVADKQREKTVKEIASTKSFEVMF
jgi:hypothetical protein